MTAKTSFEVFERVDHVWSIKEKLPPQILATRLDYGEWYTWGEFVSMDEAVRTLQYISWLEEIL